MEERELTDEEFDRGLQQVLGSRYEDLTGKGPGHRKPEGMTWERVLWVLLYGSILMTALALRGR